MASPGLPEADLQELIALRRYLHERPELSGQEKATANHVGRLLEACGPQEIWRGIGGHGVAAVFSSEQPGPTTLLRAELDGLPVQEDPACSWASARAGVSHTCGHDGHMAILLGVARHLAIDPPERGRVVLFFQPAEETGAGAAAAVRDPRLSGLEIHRIYALHNLPGYPEGQILVRPGPFCAGSAGLTIELIGRTSHAAYPEQGLSPGGAVAELIPVLVALPLAHEEPGRLALVTVGHVQMGKPGFGVTPGLALIQATVRSDDNALLEELREMAVELAQKTARRHGLLARCSWSEVFPVTENHPQATAEIIAAAEELGLEVAAPEESPFRWSEDFGHLLQLGPGAMFGLGSGVEHPPLHAENYDFNEKLLAPGIRLMCSLLATGISPDPDPSNPGQ
jgi:amidohydrolase